MSTFDQLVNDVRQTLYGYGLAQPRASFLAGAVDADDLTFTVNDASSFGQGIAEIGTEIVFIESVDENTNILTIAPDGRGYYGTTAAAHGINTRIEFAPTWTKQQVAQAINDAITGCGPTLFGVGTTEFTFNPSISTYSLPAEADGILRVNADTIGPSQEQETITRFSFNSVAPTEEFATGNTITLERGPFPGRDVTVTYRKPLTEITYGDAFTESGLAESAKTAVRYAACSQLLAFIDAGRTPVFTAQADEYDPSRSGIGTASRVSVQLYQRYQLELEQERKRLRLTYPFQINRRTR